MKTPIVILVGGPNTGKTNFYQKYTFVLPNPTTIKCTANLAPHKGIVIVDTPGVAEWRHKGIYSWQCAFSFADVILNFGNWTEREINGDKEKYNPKMMEWSGNDEETMKRLIDYLQERK